MHGTQNPHLATLYVHVVTSDEAWQTAATLTNNGSTIQWKEITTESMPRFNIKNIYIHIGLKKNCSVAISVRRTSSALPNLQKTSFLKSFGENFVKFNPIMKMEVDHSVYIYTLNLMNMSSGVAYLRLGP